MFNDFNLYPNIKLIIKWLCFKISNCFPLDQFNKNIFKNLYIKIKFEVDYTKK